MAKQPADDAAVSDTITESIPALAAKRRENEAVEEGNGESAEDEEIWLVSYIDLLTLLITFFVLMLSFADFSSQPPTKQEVQEVTQNPTARQQPFQGSSSSSQVRDTATLQFAAVLRSAVDPTTADVTVVDNSVIVEISDSVLFRPGEFELSPAGGAMIDKLALNIAVGRAFARDDNFVTVEGHTDSSRILSATVPSNWELSSNRANAVLRRLASQGVEEKRLRSVGYADTRPRASNDTAESRAKNRRVSLIFHTADSSRAAGRF